MDRNEKNSPVDRNLITEYSIIFFIVLISDLLWYNFGKPPIVENYTLNLQPIRSILIGFYPFNPYSWPGVTYPTIFNLPYNLFYGILFYSTEGNYAISFFIPNFIVEFFGAVSLFRITGIVLNHYQINRRYGFYSVILFSFNAEIIVGGLWANGLFDLGTASLPILVYASYLSIYKSRRYYGLLVLASFYLFSSFPGGYPNGAIILFEEFVISLTILSCSYALQAGKNTRKMVRRVFKSFSLNILAILIGNLYLVIPAIREIPLYLTVSKNPINYFAFGVGWDYVDSIQNTVRLLNTWVLGSLSLIPRWESTYLSNGIVMSLLFMPVILAGVSILFLKKKSDFILYLLFLLVVFLSKANHPPLGYIFTWLVNHAIFFAPFYSGAAFYPMQIIFYGIFGSVTIYFLSAYFSKFISYFRKKVKRNIRSSQENTFTERAVKITVFLTVSILLIGATYPIVAGDLSIGTQEQPAGVFLPFQYKVVNAIVSQSDSPLLVLPGTNAFNLNSYNNSSWYGGGNIYPNLFSSPTRSSMYATQGFALEGSLPYNVLTFIYGLPNSYPQNYSENILSFIPSDASINEVTQGAKVLPSSVGGYTVSIAYNYSPATNPSGIWTSEIFNEPINVSTYSFLIVNVTGQNVNLTHLQIGLSFTGGPGNFRGPGDWFYVGEEEGIFNSFIVGNSSNYHIIIQLSYPTQSIGISNLNHLTAITIRNIPGQTGNGFLNISSIEFAQGNFTKESLIFANDINMLGFKYVLVDSSIRDTPYAFRTGSYYLPLLDNSHFFKKVYYKQPLTLFENLLYNGTFGFADNLKIVPPDSSLYSMYFNPIMNTTTAFTYNSTLISDFKYSSSKPEISYTEMNPNEYRLKIHSNGQFVLIFRNTFNINFVAEESNGTLLGNHFIADGYCNGWVVPKNVKSLIIYYRGAETYTILELIFVIVPFLSFICFYIVYDKKYIILHSYRKIIDLFSYVRYK